MAYKLETRSGHNMFTMASLLQKAIRRGDRERAGYAAIELFGSYHTVLWNRIMTISCEDCWGILAKEIVALRYIDETRNQGRKGYEKDTRYVSQAITLLCDAKKSRDACYFACNFVLQTDITSPDELSNEFVKQTTREIESVEDEIFEIKNISGKVKGWKVAKEKYNCEQMTIFDMIGVQKNASGTLNSESNEDNECRILAAYLRKAIRTLDMELAGYAINNLRKKDLSYAWKTLYVISRNECNGIPTREIISLKKSDEYVNKNKGLEKRDEIYISKAIMVLMYYVSGKFRNIKGNEIINEEFLVKWDNQEYIDIRKCNLADNTVPEWVYDVHTIRGKKAGKTDWEMNLVEQEALNPLEISFFDEGSWQPRYEYKHKHGLCTEKEYLEMLEYNKNHKGNPVDKIRDKY